MAEAGGGSSGSCPAGPPGCGKGVEGGEVPGGTGWSPGAPRLPEGAGSRREESGPRQRAREGSRRAEKSRWDEDPSRVPGLGSSGLPRGKSGLPVRLQCDTYVPAALPAITDKVCPQVTEALSEGSGSRRGPAARRSWDSPRPSTSSARECGWSSRGGSPGGAADAPPFPRRRTARK